jgi:hypothetical protein
VNYDKAARNYTKGEKGGFVESVKFVAKLFQEEKSDKQNKIL